MRHPIGLNEYLLRRQDRRETVWYDPAVLINGHMLLSGMSGTGKSFQSRRFIRSAAQSGIEVDVFDVHDELDDIPGAVACRYSQATGYGFNPLVLDVDPHSGGPQRQAELLVALVRQVTPQFGAKQEAALRYLLGDVYAAGGIFQDNPGSWVRRCIGEAERERLVEARQWSALRAFYPTLADLRSYARRKLIALTVGGDSKCVTAHERLVRALGKLRRTFSAHAKAGTDAASDPSIARLKAEAVETYAAYVEAMETGRELDDLIKYDSADVLKSVMQRLDILSSTGIFQANEPPFGDARLRVHQIKSLSEAQQVLFVKLRLRAIFEEAKRQGPTPRLRRVVFLDEGHRYFTEAGDDIINVVAKEARKFGLGLWCASQSPTSFPESFLTNVGATVLLGIHASYWKRAASMLRISEDALKWIRPKEVVAVKLQREGQADPPFVNVVVPNPSTAMGETAGEHSARPAHGLSTSEA